METGAILPVTLGIEKKYRMCLVHCLHLHYFLFYSPHPGPTHMASRGPYTSSPGPQQVKYLIL